MISYEILRITASVYVGYALGYYCIHAHKRLSLKQAYYSVHPTRHFKRNISGLGHPDGQQETLYPMKRHSSSYQCCEKAPLRADFTPLLRARNVETLLKAHY